MNTRITTGVLATLLGGITLLLPGLGQAGTIGYMDMCGNDQAAHAAAISAAGHTPVYVPVPDSEALATLDGLSAATSGAKPASLPSATGGRTGSTAGIG